MRRVKRHLASALATGAALGLVLGSAMTPPARSAPQDAAPATEVLDLLDPSKVALAACRAAGRRPFETRRHVRVAASGDQAINEPARPMPGLDGVSFAVPGVAPAVRAWVDQGVALAYGFNHHEAVKAFREAQRLDPGCALCFWGEAWALGLNINAPMEPAAIEPARAAAAEALRLARDDRERALARAVVARYADGPGTPVGEAAYAAAMRAARDLAPADDDVVAIFAEALMNLQPWDYWQADGRTPKGGILEAVDAIETVLARSPDHVQAAHLYIHLTEASTFAAEAEPFADRLAALMPGAGHLVHMPGHTYYRLGRFKDALEVNLAAMAVDEAYLAAGGASAVYAGGYYPHNVHFALTSAQMAGDGPNVLHAAAILPEVLVPAIVAGVGWVQPVAAAPYFAHAQFSPPDVVMAQPEPAAAIAFPYIRAARAYARAAAAAQAGDPARAEAEAARMAELARDNDIARLTDEAGVPARTVFAIAAAVIDGRIAQARGDRGGAVRAFERAVRLQDTLPYMEPPFWYYPTRQSLGAALVMAGRPAEAAPVLEAALVESPNNGWVLFGLAEARAAIGDRAGEQAARAALARAWVGDPAQLDLARL
jgi:tetratricopeptide (TPR) repeat protein